MIDYNAGDSLTESVTACTAALTTLQSLGRSADADELLAEAESSTSYAALDADRDHTDAWKLQRYAQTYSNVMATLARKLTAAASIASAQDQTDTANVFGIAGLPGDVASLSISRRDATDRVTAVNDTVSLQRLLAQATRTGDECLARACAAQALALSDSDTLNEFLEDRPQLADAAQRLWDAQNHQMTGADVTTAWRLGALKPAPLQPLQDFEIGNIAAGQTSAGSWNG